MEQKERKPSEDGTTVLPTAEAPGTLGGGASAKEEAKGTAEKTAKEGTPDGAGKPEGAPAEDGSSAEFEGEANGLGEGEVESKVGAELQKEDRGKEEATATPQGMTDRKEETKSEPKEAEGKEETTPASEKQKADEKEAKPESRAKAEVNDEAAGEQEPKAGAREADGKEATTASREESDKTEEPKAEAQEKAHAPEARAHSQKKPAAEDEAKAGPQEADEEQVEPGSPNEEQEEGEERQSEEGAGVMPSSPEEWPESPTEEGHSPSPDELGQDTTASGETSPSASESSPSDVPQSPTEPPPSQEKKKEKAPERRVSAPIRPRGPRAQNRKAIVEKFGGAASGPTALFRNTTAAGAAIGGVKNMLLEWCRAMTKKYEHVDIQNFSSSWSSGMAFCALIHKFFPDAFDYSELDPTQRRHNFTLAFSTAEKLADCAQLLEVEDMVRLAVPDSKCVYTYIQELYRSLVQKGLVKTKKK
ncbi:PREDICTED: smoothelin-like protein 1 [Ceratotherium simum simum]|uniref:Smoothelin-like protein 1 n=1 Tax=Ceratotherium simum simum TaxID=73337 RepID=A0ABM1D950_CERSS|nr:PREDICTED: smoothelin-like protein 1 [Ceratotherium simum simum]XP_014648331.1 PREDICTED: smoothelin-like protein 1 [Ceratotherium simum simum]